MQADIEWILKALERDPTKTRTGIARALNVDKSAITRLLNGERQLKFAEAEKIAAYLGVSAGFAPADGFREDNRESYRRSATESDTAPIYEATTNFDGSWTLHSANSPIDRKQRAPYFQNAAKVFGFYSPDDVMSPRFHAGEIVWVDPARPPEVGGDVLLVKNDPTEDAKTMILATLTATTTKEWRSIQYANKSSRSYERDGWIGHFVLPRY